MRKTLLCTVKIAISGVLSVLLLSVFCFFYDNTPIAVNQPASITNYRFYPDSVWSYMGEGFGFGRIDNIGYNNAYDFDENGNDVVVFLGSSHTEALQIPQKDNFVSLTQTRLLEDDRSENDYQCLNLGISSHYFEVTASNFEAVPYAFDNMAYVVIEVNNIEYTADEFQRMLACEYRNPYTNMSSFKQLLQRIPFLRTLKKQAENMLRQDGGVQIAETHVIDLDAYEESLEPVIEKIADIANDNSFRIIVVYHSKFALTDREGLTRTDRVELVDVFREACDRHSLLSIDVSDICIEHYEATYEAPCGFMNSVIGSGHLNKTGHSIISNAVYQEICKLSEGDKDDIQ